MGPDAGPDAIAACMQSVQACFAALTPDAGSFPVPSFDAGSFPIPSFDAGSFPMPSFDAGAFPPFPDGGLPTFPPFPDAGFPSAGFPDGAAPPSQACFDNLNDCLSHSKDPTSCFAQVTSCVQGH
jgi:hypothetical protein